MDSNEDNYVTNDDIPQIKHKVSKVKHRRLDSDDLKDYDNDAIYDQQTKCGLKDNGCDVTSQVKSKKNYDIISSNSDTYILFDSSQEY